jgi:hypothetical protein
VKALHLKLGRGHDHRIRMRSAARVVANFAETYFAAGAVVRVMTRPKSLAFFCIQWICCC